MFPFSFFSLSFPLVFRSNLHSNKSFLTLRSPKPPLFFAGGGGWVGRLIHLGLLAWKSGIGECGSVGNKGQHSQRTATEL
jgi:hypothetical protein